MEMNKMKVNPLPSVTWHWTGMNDSELEMPLPDASAEFTFSGQDTEMRFLTGSEAEKYEDERFGSGICETGMGDEFAEIMRDTQSVFLDIPEGFKASEPAVITAGIPQGNAAGQIYINAGAGSEASVVISVCSGGAGSQNETDGTDGITEGDTDTAALQLMIHAGADSQLKIFAVQTLPVQGQNCLNVGGVCGERAQTEFTCLSIGSRRSYIGIAVTLEGTESSFNGDMGYHVMSDQSVDINYVARHIGSESASRLNAWGVLEDGSRKLFRGTIDFKEGCPGSKGSEKEDVLLLGTHQINQTIPLILCHEEDVEGDHGATIGRLDDQVLFYLGSRGLDEKTAEDMIARARMEALISRIPDRGIRQMSEKAAFGEDSAAFMIREDE